MNSSWLRFYHDNHLGKQMGNGNWVIMAQDNIKISIKINSIINFRI